MNVSRRLICVNAIALLDGLLVMVMAVMVMAVMMRSDVL
jgi:hypothetical protein